MSGGWFGVAHDQERGPYEVGVESYRAQPPAGGRAVEGHIQTACNSTATCEDQHTPSSWAGVAAREHSRGAADVYARVCAHSDGMMHVARPLHPSRRNSPAAVGDHRRCRSDSMARAMQTLTSCGLRAQERGRVLANLVHADVHRMVNLSKKWDPGLLRGSQEPGIHPTDSTDGPGQLRGNRQIIFSRNCYT